MHEVSKARRDLECIHQQLVVENINVKAMAQGAAEQAAKALVEAGNERQRREAEVAALVEANRVTRERLQQLEKAPKSALPSFLSMGKRPGPAQQTSPDAECHIEV